MFSQMSVCPHAGDICSWGCAWLGRLMWVTGAHTWLGRGHAWLRGRGCMVHGGGCAWLEPCTPSTPYGWQGGSTHPTGILSFITFIIIPKFKTSVMVNGNFRTFTGHSHWQDSDDFQGTLNLFFVNTFITTAFHQIHIRAQEGKKILSG